VTDQDEDFSSFVIAVWPRLFRTAYALTRNKDDAEDLVQSALVKGYSSWDRICRADAPEAYMRRLLVNHFLSWQRRIRRRRPLLHTDPVYEHHDIGTTAVDERLAMVDAIKRLPLRQRAVVVLRYYEGLTEKEIADLMQVAPGTVKSQCNAAIARLRDALGESPREARLRGGTGCT
jgi:RNA polymerase sigma-70 factor (sigma-E family)